MNGSSACVITYDRRKHHLGSYYSIRDRVGEWFAVGLGETGMIRMLRVDSCGKERSLDVARKL